MTTQHFFLTSDAVATPGRWRDAFQTGQLLNAVTLQARLRDQPAAQCIVWLSSSDQQWSDYLSRILQTAPGARIVLLSCMPDPLEGLNALNQGVRGYTHAYGVPALLQEVALAVEHGGLWVGRDLLQRMVGASSAALTNRAGLDKAKARVPDAAGTVSAVVAAPAANGWGLLSVREAQVARAVAAGRSNREVANMLFISEGTVKAHMGAVFEKIGVRDRLQLVLHLAASANPEAASVYAPLA